jgi:hypothetical protein
MPEGEMWTFRPPTGAEGSEPRLGLNLGAPGDRRAADGTLWLEYPSVGGPSPGLPLEIVPDTASYFRQNASTFDRPAGDDAAPDAQLAGVSWVAESGIRGVERLSLTLPDLLAKAEKYTIRLHFAEPDAAQPGERVFDVKVEGQVVATAFDIARETGGTPRAIVNELAGVAIDGDLDIELTPCEGIERRETILCGIELIAEDSAHAQGENAARQEKQ